MRKYLKGTGVLKCLATNYAEKRYLSERNACKYMALQYFRLNEILGTQIAIFLFKKGFIFEQM